MKKVMVMIMVMIMMLNVMSVSAFEWFWESPPPPAMTAWEAQRYSPPGMEVRYINLDTNKEKAGAVAGGIFTLGGIAVALKVIGSGLSGAEITAVLAKIGALIGGGMTSGVVMIVMGTVIVTAAGAYGGYKVVEWSVA